MTKTALYVRQSEDKTGHAAAVQRQERDCRLLAEAKGWESPTLYADNSISATNGKTRKDFERLVDDIEAGAVARVVVWHLDRLTRSMKDLARMIEAGRRHRVNIACVHGVSLDLGDPTGVAVAQILTAIAGMETAHKGERQKRANRQRAEAGNAFWSRRPFGYDRTPGGDVFIVEAEAEAIREAAGRVLAGDTMSAVIRDWNDAGLRTTAGKGGLWGVTQLRRLLLNPRYAGKRIYNGEDMGAGDWAPILPEDMSRRLEEKLNDPRRRTAPDDLNSKYLLSGILDCAKCGRKMFAAPVKDRGRQWMVYRCLGGYCMTRRLDLIDTAVEGMILHRLSLPEVADLFHSGGELSELRDKATALRERRDALASLLADGLLSHSAVREQAGRIGRELKLVTGSIEAAEGLNPVAAFVGSVDVPEVWAALPLANKRQLVRSLVDIAVLPAGKGVRFVPEQLRIEWKGAGE
jgi:site-specific DNA recombinase